MKANNPINSCQGYQISRLPWPPKATFAYAGAEPSRGARYPLLLLPTIAHVTHYCPRYPLLLLPTIARYPLLLLPASAEHQQPCFCRCIPAS
eukprot:984798-Pelagomonas_calceolata.AAC.5